MYRFRVSAIAPILAAVARANYRHAHRSSGATHCKIALQRAIRCAITLTFAKIGKIATTISTTATTIGTMAIGMATPAIGGITCGTTTRR